MSCFTGVDERGIPVLMNAVLMNVVFFFHVLKVYSNAESPLL